MIKVKKISKEKYQELSLKLINSIIFTIADKYQPQNETELIIPEFNNSKVNINLEENTYQILKSLIKSNYNVLTPSNNIRESMTNYSANDYLYLIIEKEREAIKERPFNNLVASDNDYYYINEDVLEHFLRNNSNRILKSEIKHTNPNINIFNQKSKIILNDKDILSNYLAYFYQEFNKTLNDLKKAFSIYYGQKYSTQINNSLDNLVVFFASNNIPDSKLNTKLLQYRKNVEILSQSLIEKYSLTEKDLLNLKDLKSKISLIEFNKFKTNILNYSFYLWIKNNKEDSDNLGIILGQNKQLPAYITPKNTERITKQIKNISTTTDGFSTELKCLNVRTPKIFDYICIKLEDDGMNLQTLIHEINHYLVKEHIAYEYTDLNSIKSYKTISSTSNVISISKDIINEIINDYMAKDILNIYLRLTHKKNPFIKETNTPYLGYIHFDKLSGNTIKKIYTIMAPIIKTSLIEHNGPKLEKIINTTDASTYINLNNIYLTIINEKHKLRENSDINSVIKILENKYANKTNKFYKAIKQSYIEYLMYTNNLEKIKVRKK